MKVDFDISNPFIYLIKYQTNNLKFIKIEFYFTGRSRQMVFLGW